MCLIWRLLLIKYIKQPFFMKISSTTGRLGFSQIATCQSVNGSSMVNFCLICFTSLIWETNEPLLIECKREENHPLMLRHVHGMWFICGNFELQRHFWPLDWIGKCLILLAAASYKNVCAFQLKN